LPEIQAATRSTANAEIVVRLSDLSFPAGFANFLLACDRDSCAACRP
jgi:hypothetical protein